MAVELLPKPRDKGIRFCIVTLRPILVPLTSFQTFKNDRNAKFLPPARNRSSPSPITSKANPGVSKISKVKSLYKLQAKPRESYPGPQLADVAGTITVILFFISKLLQVVIFNTNNTANLFNDRQSFQCLYRHL